MIQNNFIVMLQPNIYVLNWYQNVNNASQSYTVQFEPSINYNSGFHLEIPQNMVARPSSENQVNSEDAEFLFPPADSPFSLNASKWPTDMCSGVQSHATDANSAKDKIFQVKKIPKVAFSLVNKLDFSKSKDVGTDVFSTCSDLATQKTQEERKSIFRGRRDDLFFKTL